MATKEEVLAGLAKAVIDGDTDGAKKWAQECIKSNIDAYEALTDGSQAGIKIVGNKYAAGEMFLPEIFLSAEAMYAIMDILKPHLKKEVKVSGTIIIGVIEGDVHDIGKNIVKMMLEASGVNVVDLGRDVSVASFIEKAKETSANVVGMSSLMTTAMFRMRDVVEMMTELGLRPKIKVLIGGAPTSPEFAKSVGADAYAKDACEAVIEFQKLIKGA